LVNFLLLIENISNYSKKDIDIGRTPFDIYRLSSYIRETFCLSYNLRKDNNLFLYIQKDHHLIEFKGKKLKYLGPDERSETLLLEKVLNKIKGSIIYEDGWRKSTPGIFIRSFFDNISFINYYRLIANHLSFLIIDTLHEVNKKVEFFKLNQNPIEILDEDFFIIPTYTLRSESSIFIELFKELKNTKLISLSKIKGVENKILYINFIKDQQRTHKNLVK